MGGLDHFIFFKANVFICECAFQGEGGTKRLEGEYFVYFVHSILFLFCSGEGINVHGGKGNRVRVTVK